MSRTLPPPVLANFLPIARLKEHNEGFTKQNQIIEALLDDHESIIWALRNHGRSVTDKRFDDGTADFMAGLVRQHEKMAVALKDWLQ